MTKAQAIKFFGSQAAFAEFLGLAQSAIAQWDAVPDLRQYQIQVLTGGALMAEARLQPSQALRRAIARARGGAAKR